MRIPVDIPLGGDVDEYTVRLSLHSYEIRLLLAHLYNQV